MDKFPNPLVEALMWALDRHAKTGDPHVQAQAAEHMQAIRASEVAPAAVAKAAPKGAEKKP